MAPNNSVNAESPVLIYLKNYIDLTNNFPNDMARLMSELHQIDIKVALYIKVLESYKNRYQDDLMKEKVMKVLEKIEEILLNLEKESDSKLDVVKSMLEQIDLKSRQLEASYKLATINANPNHPLHVPNSLQCNSSANSGNYKSAGLNQLKNESSLNGRNSPVALNKEKDNNNSPASNGKRVKRGSNKNNNNNNINNIGLSQDTNNNNGSGDDRSSTPVTTNSTKRGNGKRALKTTNKAEKKGKTTNNTNIADDNGDGDENYDDAEANDESYDPDEPTYCSCQQVSYGEMICCDNDQCPIEWFHFTCVQLNSKPKGRWFCPQCRGERSNIQRK